MSLIYSGLIFFRPRTHQQRPLPSSFLRIWPISYTNQLLRFWLPGISLCIFASSNRCTEHLPALQTHILLLSHSRRSLPSRWRQIGAHNYNKHDCEGLYHTKQSRKLLAKRWFSHLNACLLSKHKEQRHCHSRWPYWRSPSHLHQCTRISLDVAVWYMSHDLWVPTSFIFMLAQNCIIELCDQERNFMAEWA